MAKLKPKKEKDKKKSKPKLSEIDFSAVAKLLKGKVSFNIDLRKTDANPSIPKGKDKFSFGTKMALYNNYIELQRLRKGANFVPIKKQKGESKTAYKKRISQTRKDFGQEYIHFNGVWTDTPNFVKVGQKRIKNDAGKWTTQISMETKSRQIKTTAGDRAFLIRDEIIVPIDKIAFAQNPRKEVLRILQKYRHEGIKSIQPQHSEYRGNGKRATGQDLKDFIARVIKWNNDYKDTKKAQFWLTGFILIKYHAVIPRGSKGTVNGVKKIIRGK